MIKSAYDILPQALRRVVDFLAADGGESAREDESPMAESDRIGDILCKIKNKHKQQRVKLLFSNFHEQIHKCRQFFIIINSK